MRIVWTLKLAAAVCALVLVLDPVSAVRAQETQSEAPSAASKRSPYRARDCEPLEKRADAKFRYLLCSVGLYDRQVKGYVAAFNGSQASLSFDLYRARGFKSETGPVPKKYEDAIATAAPDKNVVVWSDQDEPVVLVRRTTEAKRILVSTFIVSSKFIDANGLFVGAKPEDAWSKRFAKTCRSGQSLFLRTGRKGLVTCPVRFVRTNVRRQNLYHAGVALPNKPNAIEMIEITHSEPR